MSTLYDLADIGICAFEEIGVCDDVMGTKYPDICLQCNKFLAIDSKSGKQMIDDYDEDVDEALTPVKNKYKNIFNAYKGYK